MDWRYSLIAITILILVSSSSNVTTSDTLHFTQDDMGPDFRGVGNRYTDYPPNIETANDQLLLYIDVLDNDGIDTVIGSYKLTNETNWNNITLSLNHTYSNGWQAYLGYGPDFSLTQDSRVLVWDVRYYANDTLGNWNASEIGRHSYALLNFQHSLDVTLIIGAIVGIGMLALVVVVFIQKKRMTT